MRPRHAARFAASCLLAATISGGVVAPAQPVTCAPLRQVAVHTTVGGQVVDLFVTATRCGGTVKDIAAVLITPGTRPIWIRGGTVELWRMTGPATAPVMVRSAVVKTDGTARTSHVLYALGRSIPYRAGFSGVWRMTIVVNREAATWAVAF